MREIIKCLSCFNCFIKVACTRYFDMFLSGIFQGPVPRKMVKFNSGLSQILINFFLSSKIRSKLFSESKVMTTQSVTL